MTNIGYDLRKVETVSKKQPENQIDYQISDKKIRDVLSRKLDYSTKSMRRVNNHREQQNLLITARFSYRW